MAGDGASPVLINIAAFSYAIAALAFLLLGALLLTSWRSRAHSGALAMASLLTVAWCSALGWQAMDPGAYGALGDVAEIVRNGGWSVFLLLLLGHFHTAESRRTFYRVPVLALLAALYGGALLLTVFGNWDLDMLGSTGFAPSVVARLGMAVMGMLLVEQLYRNKPAAERWSIKFACLGIGGLFVYDFYMFADALLLRKINPEIWAARGVVNALTVPLIAISAARSASWSNAISVSRRVLFHSAALFGSAIYLLAMGAAGYYLRYFGGSWGSVMQVAFLFGALVLLAGILFSGTFRAWLKVFISKHFYSYNYDYREEWLRFTRTLSEEGPGLGDRAIQAVAALVESPGGALWIRRESGRCEPFAQWHLGHRNDTISDSDPLFQFLETKQWVVDFAEYEVSPEKYGNIAMPDWLCHYPRARLIVPLMLQGRLFGFVLLLEPRSSINLNWEVIDLLKIAGSQAASYLAQQEAATALMLARQFESFNRMSTFVVHDLKNLVSQLSLMATNAVKHKNNPEFQEDMLETVTLSVQKMRLMLQKLSRQSSEERPTALFIDQLLQQAVTGKAAFEPKPELHIVDTKVRVLADAERLERVVGHLIQNAIEATDKDGSVRIVQKREGASVCIEITDTGSGMSEEFIRESLFKPFESTKSAGMGIGAFESREYIDELGGRLEVASVPGSGTTFKIVLPIHQQEVHTIEKAA
jgi:putative PEP-CTERM system histidine kinase